MGVRILREPLFEESIAARQSNPRGVCDSTEVSDSRLCFPCEFGWGVSSRLQLPCFQTAPSLPLLGFNAASIPKHVSPWEALRPRPFRSSNLPFFFFLLFFSRMTSHPLSMASPCPCGSPVSPPVLAPRIHSRSTGHNIMPSRAQFSWSRPKKTMWFCKTFTRN